MRAAASARLNAARSPAGSARIAMALPIIESANPRRVKSSISSPPFESTANLRICVRILIDSSRCAGLVAEKNRTGEVNARLGDRLRHFKGLPQLGDGQLERRFVGLVSHAVWIVFARLADLDMAAHDVRHRMRVDECDQALHAIEPLVPETDVAAPAIKHVARVEYLRARIVVSEFGNHMAGTAPDPDVASTQVESYTFFRVVRHPPKSQHLFMGESHVPRVGTVDELIVSGVVVGVQMAEGEEQFEGLRLAPVASTPFRYAIVDRFAQWPVARQLREALIEHENPFVAEI